MLVIMDETDAPQNSSGKDGEEDESDYYGTIIEQLSPTFPHMEVKAQDGSHSDSELLRIPRPQTEDSIMTRRTSKEIAFCFKPKTEDVSENDSFVN